MDTLKDLNSGRYLVSTESGSEYVIDLDRKTMLRLPAMDMSVDRSLRRDGQEIHVVALEECSVGRPMCLIVNLRLPGVVATTRRSTEVQSIEEIGEDIDIVWNKR